MIGAKVAVRLLIGINRNIVECKDSRGYPTKAKKLGINRNIVECKGTIF